MKKLIFLLFIFVFSVQAQAINNETAKGRNSRMKWWREARLGMFIHWGLYSIPAGEWKGSKGHAEWIRETVKIPLEEYDSLAGQFNPVKYNAEDWVRMAKGAGMKYIVITSKHHDGFCLFDTKETSFNVTSTPFKRDILKELASACRKFGMKLCFYYSIMDWHSPDYLPRRAWEVNRTTSGADMNRYIGHMKNQIKELISNYGDIGVLWFDGEWEETWTKQLGDDLYNYIRSLNKNIIINNRVSKARSASMEEIAGNTACAGDFGTPEQSIPSTGLPGVDWESCITMNNNWGYNKDDHNFKSIKEILHMISDISSKGGNLLLNVGPTSEGLFPEISINRLAELGNWMKKNGEAIYKTDASPFDSLPWGRCTQKKIKNTTRLYLHIFDWPKDGHLFIQGLDSQPQSIYLLADKGKKLYAQKKDGGVLVKLPLKAPDDNLSIVVMDVKGKPKIISAPVIKSEFGVFVDKYKVVINSKDTSGCQIRFTLDGSVPTSSSPVYKNPFEINNTTYVSARIFRNDLPLSPVSKTEIKKIDPQASVEVQTPQSGLKYKYYEGDWTKLPDFNALKAIDEGVSPDFSLLPAKKSEKYGFVFEGYINIPNDGIFTFALESDDGSKMFLGNNLLIDNDFCHGMKEMKSVVALKAGLHPIRVIYFNATGASGLKISYQNSGKTKESIPGSAIFH